MPGRENKNGDMDTIISKLQGVASIKDVDFDANMIAITIPSHKYPAIFKVRSDGLRPYSNAEIVHSDYVPDIIISGDDIDMFIRNIADAVIGGINADLKKTVLTEMYHFSATGGGGLIRVFIPGIDGVPEIISNTRTGFRIMFGKHCDKINTNYRPGTYLENAEQFIEDVVQAFYVNM